MGDKQAISQARKDGRPQYYDVFPNDRLQCVLCLTEDSNQSQYGRTEGFMCDPGNSPLDDGGVYTLCLKHLPDDAVIFDPMSNVCRTKDGSSTWTEKDTTEGILPPSFE